MNPPRGAEDRRRGSVAAPSPPLTLPQFRRVTRALKAQRAADNIWQPLIDRLNKEHPPMARQDPTKRRRPARAKKDTFAPSKEAAAAIQGEPTFDLRDEQLGEARRQIVALSGQLQFVAQHLAVTQDRYIASLIEAQRLTFDQGAQRVMQERQFVEQQLAAIAAQFAPAGEA